MADTVLVVDDDPVVRSLVVQTLEPLEDAGVRLVEASSGPDAVAVARAELPKVVLLDLMMPGMNGYEVCEVLRSDRALAGVKIALLTGRDQAFDRVHGAMVGADLYLTKPFDPAELLRVVRGLLWG